MTSTLRAQRLNQITHAPHSRLDALVKANAPFESRESFARFVLAQFQFQAALQAYYSEPGLCALLPDLPQRCRADQARADLLDLGTEVPLVTALPVMNQARALGWLFVSEGSKLGAGFLIKRASAMGLSEGFGARHLGEPAGGRAEGWKQFATILNSLPLSSSEEADLDRGALEAFEHFGELLGQAYADAPQAC
ncbi:hypothetical protein ALP05_02444 [Pseudomonas caricapapayae]|uniref:Heme oxygenase n=1 Tax=Pseudomonas caricapapayae TaxID=46678 RepID=A0A3M6F934_9PSED|nr:biliverdin-producing heme oxygenase [Pseudomonas caricapapayae]RMV76777.1 hypothetical protein ALP05_02444 [Pseudomonas caricapapayae]